MGITRRQALWLGGAGAVVANAPSWAVAGGPSRATDASLYPSKADAIAAYNERINTVADFLESCDEAVFAQSSAGKWYENYFPTLGGGAAFMMIGHIPFHLGQISAWRRVAGMGLAM